MDAQQSALFLFEEAMGFTYSAALRAAAEIGVADHLAAGPRTTAELAAATGTGQDALYRILRLLAARDVVHEDEPGRFRLTARGDALRTDAPMSARAGILMFTDRMFWTVSHEAATVARDEATTFEQLFGTTIGGYFAENADTEALFYDGMATVSEAENALVAGSYSFPPAGTVVDVGGGKGGFLRAVLRANPGLHGVLLDQEEHVLGHHLLDGGDITGRWQVADGDFFDSVPAGDVYLIKRILHNWDDEKCVAILRNCRRAMKPDGRVLAVDAIVPAGNEAHQSKPMDFMMLAARTGRERTEAELHPLFEAAGLRLARVLPTASVMSIAEGVPS
ncbi:SAM-dependent methyltransferase [Actinomadura luteofluorescens]|uniref:SAM-dependent methyltransferase n=1 Tax=Actinomadura luteofluorescens TaxID=46163 RepID=A0A7Y9JMF0_9ACTN|nr:methyltransferase [Actinomadura luteofluorescens]NYD52539.1 SAM-dependent methyltransferase [Actinomadura luteofluorescens]